MSVNSKKFLNVIFYFVPIAAVIVGGFVLYNFRGRESSIEYVDQFAKGSTMGTFYSIRIHNFPKNKDWNAFTAEIQKQLDQIEQKMSLFDPNSEISRFNSSKSLDWFSVSSDTFQVVRLALEVSAFSGGAFDITAAPLVNIWGFGVKRKRLSIDEIINEIDKQKINIGYEKLAVQLNPPAIKKTVPELQIDLSAIAKGYAVDVISRFCGEYGVRDYMVEIGGEVCCCGDRGEGNEWRVGIEMPVIIPRGEWGRIYQIINIKNQSMATSGGNRNFHIIGGKYYSHLIDPRTGLPCLSGNEDDLVSEEQLASVSVVDKNCARADALATAFFVLGANEGLKIANENHIPVLFLIRKNKNIRELASDSFYNTASKSE
ncbi:MAG: FAD:protein FMN transferase [Planctomycetaceae bacterium]|jgi:thiamine biosynthesis lipoprotein|nr:FAD:protein FMN transferase [Planctomycetaceae bacterium]